MSIPVKQIIIEIMLCFLIFLLFEFSRFSGSKNPIAPMKNVPCVFDISVRGIPIHPRSIESM